MDNKPELRLINMAGVEATDVQWLWYPYIPYGKITIIQGDPGEGKTTLVLNLAAILSRGEKLPETDTDIEPVNIIYQTAEAIVSEFFTKNSFLQLSIRWRKLRKFLEKSLQRFMTKKSAVSKRLKRKLKS